MAAILAQIYCWLQGLLPSFQAMNVMAYDGLLSVADGLLGSFPVMTMGSIDSDYTWLLGATGVSQALAIIAGAMITRFVLQTIPFVRWGS